MSEVWDEVSQLRTFRLNDADADDARGYARQTLYSAMRMGRRRRRQYSLGVAVVAGALAVSGAYAVAQKLRVGDPAPEEIKQQLARFGNEPEPIPYPHPGEPLANDAKVVSVLESSAGPAYLFGVPTANGLCGWTWIVGRRGHENRPDLSSACGARNRTFWSITNPAVDGRIVRILSGRAGDGISRIAVRVAGGTVVVPLVDRWFFAELEQNPSTLVTYDRTGRAVQVHEIHHEPIPVPVAPKARADG